MLGNHEGNAPNTLDAMQICCDQIINCVGEDDDLMLKVFDALGTSDDEDFLFFSRKREIHGKNMS